MPVLRAICFCRQKKSHIFASGNDGQGATGWLELARSQPFPKVSKDDGWVSPFSGQKIWRNKVVR